MFATVVLVFFGLSFLAFGLWALFAPVSLAALVHFGMESPASVTEIRAFYGGLEIGLAAFLIWSAFDKEMLPAALIALAAVAGGIALARVAGILVDGSASGMMFGALAFESLGAIFAVAAWFSLAR